MKAMSEAVDPRTRITTGASCLHILLDGVEMSSYSVRLANVDLLVAERPWKRACMITRRETTAIRRLPAAQSMRASLSVTLMLCLWSRISFRPGEARFLANLASEGWPLCQTHRD